MSTTTTPLYGTFTSTAHAVSVPKSDLYRIARQCMEQMHADEVRDLLRTHFAEYLIVEVKP